MKKRFNTTGCCDPTRHYMADISSKVEQIEALIDDAAYFTINRARQYGKTTILRALMRSLAGRYKTLSISFEGTDVMFTSSQRFCDRLCHYLGHCYGATPEQTEFWDRCRQSCESIEELSDRIGEFCKSQEKPTVLMIDEVDKCSDNQIFLDFIGMLRSRYLERDLRGYDSTFHSVILAGVYDVKNLKLRIRPDEERRYNSPWNIATDFNVEMSLSADEIGTMLQDYEADHATGMDVRAVATEIYKFTSGYPYLVSKVCELIDRSEPKRWDKEGVESAIKALVKDGDNTLLNDLTKNIELYPEFESLMYDLLLTQSNYNYEPNVPSINLGRIFSAIKEDADGRMKPHNLIFEQKLYNYFVAKRTLAHSQPLPAERNRYIKGGKLQMPHVIERFQHLMREEYRHEDERFLERQGRLLFLCFLKPIINGSGFYYVEPETRENSRMDIVVTYGGEEHIIELKIWRGARYETDGKSQLANYLAIRGLSEGYLVTFSFQKERPEQETPQWVEHDGKRIYEAII